MSRPNNPSEMMDEFRSQWQQAGQRAMQPAYAERDGRGPVLGIASGGMGGNYHADQPGYMRSIETARYYDRRSYLVRQAVNRLVANVVQEGFVLDPATGSEAVDQRIKELWAAWSESRDEVDAAGCCRWHDVEKLAFRATIVDGDCFAMPLNAGPRAGRLQMFEAHNVRSPLGDPASVLGVILGSFGQRRGYWIASRNLQPLELAVDAELQRVAAFNAAGEPAMFHVAHLERFGQARGVSAIDPVRDCVRMHEDIQFANLVKQQVAAFFAIFRKRSGNGPFGTPARLGASETQNAASVEPLEMEQIHPGMILTGAVNEELEGFAPNIPASNFFEHCVMVMTFIAINLDMPVHMLLLDPSRTNFSGWRGAIDQARIAMAGRQRNLEAALHRPVYTWKLGEWLRSDAILRRLAAELPAGQLYAHRWNKPAWRYLQPEVEVNADAKRLENNLTSPRRLAAERGMEWRQVAAEIADDEGFLVEAACRRAAAINAAFPEANVSWRDLTGYGRQAPEPAAGAEKEEEEEVRSEK